MRGVHRERSRGLVPWAYVRACSHQGGRQVEGLDVGWGASLAMLGSGSCTAPEISRMGCSTTLAADGLGRLCSGEGRHSGEEEARAARRMLLPRLPCMSSSRFT